MAIYKYKAKNKFGTIVEGERNARNEKEVHSALVKDQLTVMSISKKSSRLLSSKGKSVRKKKVGLRDLSVFNRQLSVMFNAGLSVTESLGILAKQQKNKYFAAALEDVKQDIEAGSNFSNSLKKYPDIFDNLYCNLVQAGEASGNLDTVLKRLSEYIEKTAKLVSKVKSAMAYPVSVLVIAIGITAVILYKVVPVFADMFKQLGAELPLPTQMVVGASNFLRDHIILIILAVIGLVFAFKSYYNTYKGRRNIDRYLLRVPVIGDLLLKAAVAKVTRTLATLMDAGVDIVESIAITAKTAGNSIIEDAVMNSRYAIQEGRPLYESWEEEKVFPFMVTQMIAVGEQTGALSQMLEKVAEFYDDEVDVAVSALISIMEPVMIVILGGLVGAIVIAMYLPMFALIGELS